MTTEIGVDLSEHGIDELQSISTYGVNCYQGKRRSNAVITGCLLPVSVVDFGWFQGCHGTPRLDLALRGTDKRLSRTLLSG